MFKAEFVATRIFAAGEQRFYKSIVDFLEVTVLIHKVTKDRRAGEYRLHIKKVLGFKHWDKRKEKPKR